MPANVMIFGGGGYNDIQIYFSLKHCLRFHPIMAGSYSNHAEYICNDAIDDLPYTYEPSFISKLNECIDKHNIKPTIVLPDDEFNKIAVGTDFDPLKDVKAYDSQGNDLTSQIVVLGSVDVDKAGRYELTYQVADSFNNVTIVTRVVEVVENDDDQDINVQPGDDSNPNGTTGTNGTTSASVNTPFTGDLVNSNYLTLAIASLMTFILMIKKYLKDLKNNH